MAGMQILGLPCQSASPADSYICRLWREVSGVVLNQNKADLRGTDDDEALVGCWLTRLCGCEIRRPAVWSRSRDAAAAATAMRALQTG